MTTPHLFSSPRVKMLYQETLEQHIKPGAQNYTEMERLIREWQKTLTDDTKRLGADQREALTYAMATAIEMRSQLSGGESDNILSTHEHQARASHVRLLEEKHEELKRAKASANKSWIDQVSRQISTLDAVTARMDGKTPEPFRGTSPEEIEANTKKAEQNTAHVTTLKADDDD